MELNQENFGDLKLSQQKMNNENNFGILIDYGYIYQEENGMTQILFKIESKANIIDTGLVVGLTQNDSLVDAHFLGSANMDKFNIKFNEKHIIKDGKKYTYDELGINLQPEAGYIINKNEEKLLELSDDAFKMFSSVYGIQEENNCVISVLDGKICACCLKGEEVLWVNQIDIGNNTFDDKTRKIITDNETFELADCYLRVCMKNIYLHIDKKNKSKILGKTNNPFYDY